MVPTDPGAYSTDTINNSNAVALRKQYVAEHKIKQKIHKDYLSVKEVGKELILYTVSNDALASLKRQYVGFGDMMILAMINHLHLKMAIRITTAQN